jgi:ribosomal protein S18 acetylase RimI-like enzyme
MNAINFYLKNGFVKIKEVENYYSDGESAYIMQYNKIDN